MESDKRFCKMCNELKLRIHTGQFDKKNKRYEDTEGGVWSGRTCPTCHRMKMKNVMKMNRLNKKTEEEVV